MSVELTIDGTRVTGKKGQTILEVDKKTEYTYPPYATIHYYQRMEHAEYV